MSLKDQIQRELLLYRLAVTVALWLVKGMCLGFGAFAVWKVCHALGTM